MQILLAIETSQRLGSVALRDRRGNIHEEPLVTHRRHDDDLLPAIDRLTRRVGLGPRDLTAVGVSVGPGGFTGLRIAVSTAMMFAEALGVQIAAVPSALVAAMSTSTGADRVLCALACKDDTFWATVLSRDDSQWRVSATPGLVSSSDFALEGIDAVLADEHLPAPARQRCEAAGVPLVHPVFTAQACLLAAEQLLAEGDTVDPLRLSPIYPRQPEAVSIWEQRHGRA